MIADKLKPIIVASTIISIFAGLVGCNESELFKYHDTEGVECKADCDPEQPLTPCTEKFECNVAPEIPECPNPPDFSEPLSEGEAWHACWFVGGTYIAELGDESRDMVMLCQGCCCEIDWCLQGWDETCHPMICEEDGPSPPEPWFCRDGYVFRR